jgi:hypothetical protein
MYLQGKKEPLPLTPEGVTQVITPNEIRGKEHRTASCNSVGVELLRSSDLGCYASCPEFHSGLLRVELLPQLWRIQKTIFLKTYQKSLIKISKT